MNWGGNNSNSIPKPPSTGSANSTQFSSPTHQYAGTIPSPRAPSTPIHQARSPGEPAATAANKTADYSRSHFDNSNGVKAAGAAAAPLGKPGGGDIFADILGQQGYNFASKSNFGPRSINEMRKEEMVKDMDPDKLRILEWVSHIQFSKKDIFITFHFRRMVKRTIFERYCAQCTRSYGRMPSGTNVKCINL